MTVFGSVWIMQLFFTRIRTLACILSGFVMPQLMASIDWMKTAPDTHKLSALTLVGTHNSCALYGGDYAQCQSMSLKDQLELGVRFLDIRCQWRDENLHVVHGIADQKMLFSEVADVCLKFLKEHPSETVMMSIMEQSSRSKKKGDFSRAYKKVIHGERGRWYQKKSIPSLGAARGKIVVVTRSADVEGIPWSSFSIQDSFWINKENTLEDKWMKVVSHFADGELANKPRINFVSCTGILYPPNFTAKILNKKLMVYLEEKEGSEPGIVMVDFLTPELYEVMTTAED